MVAIKKCCGCMTLRQGTYMSAIYAIILSVIGVSVCAVLIHNTNALVKEAMNEMGRETFNDQQHYEQTENIASTFVKVVYWIALAIYLAWFLTAILVFPALKTEKRGLLMPFLVFTGVLTGICIFGVLSSFTRIGETFANTTSIVSFIMQLVIICINIYVMLCISSFYKNNLREAHEVNALPVTSAVISGPGMASSAPPAYSYNYHPAAASEPMAKGPQPGNNYQQPPPTGPQPGYNYQQPPPTGPQPGYPGYNYHQQAPVYGHESMTQKI